MPGVVTPGSFDLRHVVPRVPWLDLIGRRRCRDVGTFDQWDWPVIAASCDRLKGGTRSMSRGRAIRMRSFVPADLPSLLRR